MGEMIGGCRFRGLWFSIFVNHKGHHSANEMFPGATHDLAWCGNEGQNRQDATSENFVCRKCL